MNYRLKRLLEDIFLRQIQTQALSGITGNAFEQRMTNPELYNGVELLDALLLKDKDALLMDFAVEPTNNTGTKVDAHGNKSETNLYNVQVQFITVSRALGDLTSFMEYGQDVRVKRLQAMIAGCPVQVYSDDASFFWQGGWEDLSAENAAIYPFQGIRGDATWRNRHAASGGLRNEKIRVTKHVQQVIDLLPSLVPQIAQGVVVQ